MTVYTIVDWNRVYENSRSRQIDDLRWVSLPNKHDSFGFRSLMSRPNGAALYGAWCLIVQVASKCSPRGSLIKNGVPLTPEKISFLTGCPPAIISECLDVVQLPEIAWISQASDAQAKPERQVSDAQVQPERQSSDAQVKIPETSERHSTAEALAEDRKERKEEVEGKKELEVVVKASNKQGTEERNLSVGQNGNGNHPAIGPFETWWVVWSGTRGTHHKQQALQAWMSVVNGKNADLCFECTASYLASLDNPARGYNPHTFLFEHAKDGFRGRWPISGQATKKQPGRQITDGPAFDPKTIGRKSR